MNGYTGRAWLPVLAAVCVSGAAIFASISLDPFSDLRTCFVLVAVLLVLGVLPFLARLVWGRLDPLDPAIWFSLTYSLELGTRPIYDYYFDSPVLQFRNHILGFNHALLLAIIGLSAFWVGNRLLPRGVTRSWLRPLPRQWGRNRALHAILGAATLGWIARIAVMYAVAGGPLQWVVANKDQELLHAHFGLIYLTMLADTLPQLAWLMAYICARWYLLGALTLVEIPYLLLAGRRSAPLQLFVGAYVVTRMLKGRSGAGLLTAGVALTIVLFPLITAVRYLGLSNIRMVSEEGPTTAVELQAMGSRFYALDVVAWLGTRVPQVYGHTWGRELAGVPVAWIPRAVWQKKPTTSSTKVMPNDDALASQSRADAGYDIDLLAEFYLDCGLLGVVLGMLLVGVGLAAMYDYLRPPTPSNALVLGQSLLIAAFLLEADIAAVMTQVAFGVGLVVAASLFAGGTGFARSTNRRHPAKLSTQR
jgi:hypothetical protein